MARESSMHGSRWAPWFTTGPHQDEPYDRADYYRSMSASASATFTHIEAAIALANNQHWGPWDAAPNGQVPGS